MRRRRFLAALALLGASPALRAREPALIGYLGFEPLAASKARVAALQRELERRGHAVRIAARSAEKRGERLAQLAQELVAARPALLVSESSLTTLPLRQATSTLPIVMAACDDPLASRFVRALDQPGGNITGVAVGVRDELPAQVELLQLMIPAGASFAGIFNPASAMYRKARAGLHYGAVQRKLDIHYHDATDAAGIDAAFAAAMKDKPAGIIVTYDALFVAERARFVKLAAAAKLPVVFPERSFVAAGGAVSHGPSLLRAYTLAAGVAARILAGEQPGQVPVQPVGKYETVASRKAPAAVAKRADAVL
jgi:putative ABC transport system substrate-binding protein